MDLQSIYHFYYPSPWVYSLPHGIGKNMELEKQKG